MAARLGWAQAGRHAGRIGKMTGHRHRRRVVHQVKARRAGKTERRIGEANARVRKTGDAGVGQAEGGMVG